MTPSNDKLKFKQLYHEMWQALIAKNIDRLNDIFTADFVLIHMTGKRQPKAEYLREVLEGELNYFSERTENLFIDVDAGKMMAQSKVEATVYGGGKNTWRLQLNLDVEKISSKWFLKCAQASNY